MVDHAMGEDDTFLARDELEQVLLDEFGVGLPGEAEAIGDPLDVGVHDDPIGEAPDNAANDVGRLAAEVRSSIEVGTWPSKRSSSSCARPSSERALLRKKPVGLMISSSSSCRALVSARGVGYFWKRAGVTALTRASVHCAASTVATSSWKGFW